MEIKVLGPGCPNCKDLERRVKKALEELKLKADVIKVTDYAEIGKYIMMTPGLVINGKGQTCRQTPAEDRTDQEMDYKRNLNKSLL